MNSRFSAMLLLVTALAMTGCSGAFWGGTAGGAGATGAGYELRARQQMEKLKDDKNAGRIDQEEYDIRKDQIERMSLAY